VPFVSSLASPQAERNVNETVLLAGERRAQILKLRLDTSVNKPITDPRHKTADHRRIDPQAHLDLLSDSL
jgi:hypothetical protein